MKQEYITSKGKIIIEKNVLYNKILKFRFTETVLFEVGLPIVALVAITLSFALAESQFDYFRAIIYMVLFGRFVLPLYQILFKKSYSNRIDLDRIKSYELKLDIYGLETEVVLHLENGRYRSILFRNLENQYQPFTDAISQHTSQPQLAV